MSNLSKFEVGQYLGDFSVIKNVILTIIINLKGYMVLLFYNVIFGRAIQNKKSYWSSHLLIAVKFILVVK